MDLKKPLPHPPSSSHHLVCELTTSSTWRGIDTLSSIHEVGVEISIESLRVGLNLAQPESRSSVNRSTSRVVGQTSSERSSHAPNAHAVVLASNRLWVRERQSWWAEFSLGRLVDVSGSACRRYVFSTDVVETDVVADGLELGVDAEVVEADGAWETAGCGFVGVDDLVWGCLDAVGGSEWDWESLCALGVALGVAVLRSC